MDLGYIGVLCEKEMFGELKRIYSEKEELIFQVSVKRVRRFCDFWASNCVYNGNEVIKSRELNKNRICEKLIFLPLYAHQIVVKEKWMYTT